MENGVININENSLCVTLNLTTCHKLKEIISQVEKEVILQMVIRCGGDRKLAAKKLGIGLTTLWRKINESPWEDDDMN
ncbi:MAG: helix-turn-helix domain-containing protein [Thermincola sp.]|jgi:transcriptional regulator with PAS, ATPase and Fis domain|nr:helix-turn-helix domain-containing protein [Thermincola sp.]MDT3702515.1 helix-turn-helix domain-containing protein [Thermincola sp.]